MKQLIILFLYFIFYCFNLKCVYENNAQVQKFFLYITSKYELTYVIINNKICD
jgi:hypothetical protein